MKKQISKAELTLWLIGIVLTGGLLWMPFVLYAVLWDMQDR